MTLSGHCSKWKSPTCNLVDIKLKSSEEEEKHPEAQPMSEFVIVCNQLLSSGYWEVNTTIAIMLKLHLSS